MISRQTIQKIKESQKTPMTFDDYANYSMHIFPLAFLAIGLSMLYNYFKFRSDVDVLLASVCLFSIGFFLFCFTAKRLRENIAFEKFEMTTNETIESVAEKIKINFRLRGVYLDREQGLIEAYTKWTAFSWGEKLTLILDGKTILLNSRPTGISQPLTIYKDRQNIKRLKEILAIQR